MEEERVVGGCEKKKFVNWTLDLGAADQWDHTEGYDSLELFGILRALISIRY